MAATTWWGCELLTMSGGYVGRGGAPPGAARLRESIFVCTCRAGEAERVGHVRAWDDREAAEVFARELALESDGGEVPVHEIRVHPLLGGEGLTGTIGA